MMNKEEAEKVVKETIEYANQEIRKKKKRYLKIFVAVLGMIVLLVSAYLLVFVYETPVEYKNDMINVNVPEDKGLDIKINLSNYKKTKAILVKIDENTYDLYINVTQTISTKLFDDNDVTDNMLRAGNGMVVDFQSGLLQEYLPNGNPGESIMHIYYIDNLSDKTMTMDDSELINYKNKILIWTRE